MILKFPYGKNKLELDLEDKRVLSIVRPLRIEGANNEVDEISKALSNPIKAEKLTDLASKGMKICVIVNDHTRAAPNLVLIPPILEKLKKAGCRMDNTSILVANGLHKPASYHELEELLGKKILEDVDVVNHNAEDEDQLTYVGRTSFGTDVSVNKLIVESDLVIATGLIAPHFFAGYSGGRKSILPGSAADKGIFQNHCFKMINHPNSQQGILDGNPVHEDMVEAAKLAGLNYIVNVIVGEGIVNKGSIVNVYAGDPYKAHKRGVRFLNRMVKVKIPAKTEIVITSNGGHPLDRDLYQAVKCMATGESVVERGGVIIVLAECIDGIGRDHESFYQLMADSKSPDEVLQKISREEPIKDQWEAQILSRILRVANIIVVTKNVKHSLMEDMHLIPASNIEEALALSYQLSNEKSKITAIPNGPYVIPYIEKTSSTR